MSNINNQEYKENDNKLISLIEFGFVDLIINLLGIILRGIRGKKAYKTELYSYILMDNLKPGASYYVWFYFELSCWCLMSYHISIGGNMIKLNTDCLIFAEM